jgi:hypothetical protein
LRIVRRLVNDVFFPFPALRIPRCWVLTTHLLPSFLSPPFVSLLQAQVITAPPAEPDAPCGEPLPYLVNVLPAYPSDPSQEYALTVEPFAPVITFVKASCMPCSRASNCMPRVAAAGCGLGYWTCGPCGACTGQSRAMSSCFVCCLQAGRSAMRP